MKAIVPNHTEAFVLPNTMTAAEVKELLVAQGIITDAFTYTVDVEDTDVLRFVQPRGGEKG